MRFTVVALAASLALVQASADSPNHTLGKRSGLNDLLLGAQDQSAQGCANSRRVLGVDVGYNPSCFMSTAGNGGPTNMAQSCLNDESVVGVRIGSGGTCGMNADNSAGRYGPLLANNNNGGLLSSLGLKSVDAKNPEIAPK